MKISGSNAKELFYLATYDVPFDTKNPHNYRVWEAFKILKEHMIRLEKERDEALAKIKTGNTLNNY